jgi:ribonuclease R
VIHRLLRYALAGKPAPAATRKAYERVARMASLAEMRAADAERESVKFKLTQLMAQKVGQEIVGIITGVTEWGLYVKDKETTAEGLVGLRTMSEDTFTFDPRRAMLVAQNRGQTFRIGDTIRVKVVAANPERRQIDYALVS